MANSVRFLQTLTIFIFQQQAEYTLLTSANKLALIKLLELEIACIILLIQIL